MKPKSRKPLSKVLRFEVFKRDNFTCAYCGNTPPRVILEIDHIEPVSNGGTNNINNLITSCFDCNRGKRNIKLDTIPNTISDNFDVIIEKEKQYKAYQKVLKKINKRLEFEIQKIDDIYSNSFHGYMLSDNFKIASVKNFINKLGFLEVEESMYKACSYIKNPYESIKYFCGICWNKIKNQ